MMGLVLPVSVLWKSYRHPQPLLQIVSLVNSSHVPAKKNTTKKKKIKVRFILIFCDQFNISKFLQATQQKLIQIHIDTHWHDAILHTLLYKTLLHIKVDWYNFQRFCIPSCPRSWVNPISLRQCARQKDLNWNALMQKK